MTLPCVVRIAELEAELAAERARTDALVIAMNAGCGGDAYWKAVFAAKSEIEKARSLMIPTLSTAELDDEEGDVDVEPGT